MGIELAVQTKIFFLAVALGMGLGLLYDGLRCVRIAIKAGRLITAIFDLVYCLSSLCILFVFILTVCRGQMRGYIWIGSLMGLVIYFNGLSHWVMGIMHPIIKFFRIICGKIRSFCNKAFKVFVKNFENPRGN